jgi:hypothetical protein
MAANAPGAYGIYPQDVALQQVVQSLSRSGFALQNICMMVSPKHPLAKIVRDGNILNAKREQNTVTASLMAWLFEFGAVMIPTVGFFVRSQAFLRALVKGDSSAICGSSGALVGLGFPEKDARRFEKEIRDVGILVYVACSEDGQAAEALEILRKTGAREPAMLDNAMLDKMLAATAAA